MRSRFRSLRRGATLCVTFSLALLASCATTEGEGHPSLLSSEAEAQAKVDETRAYIDAAKLEPLEVVRVIGSIRLQSSNRRFAVVEIGSSSYILETKSDCRALESRNVDEAMVDYRVQRRMLRAGYDTIRGCRIKTIYELPKTGKQATASDDETVE